MLKASSICVAILVAVFLEWGRPRGENVLFVNEIMTASAFTNGAMDEDGEFQGWIELYNGGDNAIELTGYYLSNNPQQPRRWRFPAGRVSPHEFLVVWTSAKNKIGANGELHTNFQLSGAEPILLTAPDGNTLIDSLQAPSEIDRDESYGRHPDGHEERIFYTNLTSSPGQSNPEPEFWAKVINRAPFPPRDYGGDVVFSGKMWLLGGWPGRKKDVWYSADGINWTLATANPGWPGRHVFGCVVFNDRIWVIGGTSLESDVWHSSDGVDWIQATSQTPWGPNKPGRSVVHRNKMWFLAHGKTLWSSTDGADWTEVMSQAPWPERGSPTFQVFKDRMWVMGGGTWRTGDDVIYNDVWYSSDGVNWSCATRSAPWPARRWAASQVYRDKMWLMGGHYGLDGEPKNYNDVWYTEDGVRWEPFVSKTIFTPRHSSQSWIYKDALWLAGGYYHSFALYNDVWKLNLPEY